MKSRSSFKIEWRTYLFNHGLNGIGLHSVRFELFKKVLLVALGRSAQEKSSFFAFRRGIPLARNIFFLRRKIKITFFAEKLRDISQRNSARFREETPRDFAELLREISGCVGKDLRFLHADSEDSDQTDKLSECPAWYESSLDGS